MTEAGSDARARVLAEARARAEEVARQRRQARPEEYVYDKSQDAFWDLLDGSLHNDRAVDKSIPELLWRVVVDDGEAPEPGDAPRRGRPRRRRERLIPPSQDISRVENDQFVEGCTWWPGQSQIIKDIFVDKDGARMVHGRRALNTYRAAPIPQPTNAAVSIWTDHVKMLFPETEECDYFFDYCAHMLQRPTEKCNTAIVLSGEQGIGKDAALAPLKEALGHWNCKNIDPDELFSPYKPWLQTLMLVIDEVRPSNDEFKASSFYNILKPMIAAPPDVLPLNDKYAKLRYVINLMRVFMTTNDRLAMHIPEGDRRIFLMHSPLQQNWHTKESRPEYFNQFFSWMKSGGSDAVSIWLRERDIRNFNAKSPAPRTASWQEVTSTWEQPDDAFSAALAELGHPDVVMSAELVSEKLKACTFDHKEEIRGIMKSPRKLAHRMEQEGYLAFPPPAGVKRWTFVGPKGKIDCRRAFVKKKVASTNSATLALIIAHGAALTGGGRVVGIFSRIEPQ